MSPYVVDRLVDDAVIFTSTPVSFIALAPAVGTHVEAMMRAGRRASVTRTP